MVQPQSTGRGGVRAALVLRQRPGSAIVGAGRGRRPTPGGATAAAAAAATVPVARQLPTERYTVSAQQR